MCVGSVNHKWLHVLGQYGATKLVGKHSSGLAFCAWLVTSWPHLVTPPLPPSLPTVSHISGLCGGCRPRPQPPVFGRLPELFVLLPQRWRGGEQEAQLLLRHLVGRGCWPHHMVRESSLRKDVPANRWSECAHTLCFHIFFIGHSVFLTGSFNIKTSAEPLHVFLYILYSNTNSYYDELRVRQLSVLFLQFVCLLSVPLLFCCCSECLSGSNRSKQLWRCRLLVWTDESSLPSVTS